MRKDILYLLAGAIAIAVLMGYLYNSSVIVQPETKFVKIIKKVFMQGKAGEVKCRLAKSTYLLKVKHAFSEGEDKKIFFNGSELRPNTPPYVVRKGVIETLYILIPGKLVNDAENAIAVEFSGSYPADVTFIIYNYRSNAGKDLYIAFSDSLPASPEKAPFRTTFLILLSIWLGIYFISKAVYVTPGRLFLYQVYALLPLFLLLFILWIAYNFGGVYRICISDSYFWSFGIVSFLTAEGFIILIKLIREYKRLSLAKNRIRELFYAPQAPLAPEELLVNYRLLKIFVVTVKWLEVRVFSDRCIIVFIILLAFCIFFLILHLDALAYTLANAASVFLITGITIKFIRIIRGGEPG